MTSLPAATRANILKQLGWPSRRDGRWQTVQGGDICAAYRLASDTQRVFIKTHAASRIDMFAAEVDALESIAATDTIRVPAVYFFGADEHTSWLVLEWLDFVSPAPEAHAALGAQLAALHRTTAQHHGWHKANFIGLNEQSNREHVRWCDFFVSERLGQQRQLAHGAATTRALLPALDRVIDELPERFADHEPPPSLLHGDLWGGNWAAVAGGQPVIFDPASYYGDRETDLAMAELFGGFDREFFLAYDATWPRLDGYAQRRDLYQLYHVINHANLFGGGYMTQAQTLMQRILAA
ncbi:MAG: fructosamine kinase family protein [Gammaproteobacteria bacterium]